METTRLLAWADSLQPGDTKIYHLTPAAAETMANGIELLIQSFPLWGLVYSTTVQSDRTTIEVKLYDLDFSQRFSKALQAQMRPELLIRPTLTAPANDTHPSEHDD